MTLTACQGHPDTDRNILCVLQMAQTPRILFIYIFLFIAIFPFFRRRAVHACNTLESFFTRGLCVPNRKCASAKASEPPGQRWRSPLLCSAKTAGAKVSAIICLANIALVKFLHTYMIKELVTVRDGVCSLSSDEFFRDDVLASIFNLSVS